MLHSVALNLETMLLKLFFIITNTKITFKYAARMNTDIELSNAMESIIKSIADKY